MRAKLLCRTGELSGKTYSLTVDTVIGRGDGSNVVISSDLISARHACIRQDSKGFILEDLQSANGTWLDGERVVEPVRLDRLNVISLAGTFDLIFQADAVPTEASLAAKPPAAKPRVAAPPVAAPPVAAPPVVASPVAASPVAASPVAASPAAAKPTATTPVVPPRPDVVPPAPAGAQETHFFSDFERLPTLEGAPLAPPAARDETLEVGGITRGVSPRPADPAHGAADMGGSTLHLDGPFELPPLEPAVTTAVPKAVPAVYCLEISGARISTHTVELVPSRRYTLGRAMDCDIPLDEEQVSRYHATVTVGEVVLVEDAGSSNGTHIDGRRLTTPVEIVPGATFTLGPSISVTLIRR